MFRKLTRKNRATAVIDRSVGFAVEQLEARRLMTIPANPTGLVVASATPSALTLHWTDNANNETGFAIERLINGNWGTLNGNLSANTQSYTDSGLTANTAYAYRVHAFNASGNSSYAFIGNAVTAPPVVVTVTPPFAPYFLAATANTSSQVSLTWYDNSGTETGVNVERKLGNGSYSVIATLAPYAQSYTDNGVASGSTYTYRVDAFNTAGPSPYTNESAVSTPGGVVPVTPPAAPSNLNSTAASSSQINLSWTDNSSNETGFNIERQNGAAWTVVGNVPANTTSYSDGSLSAATAYSYRVTAVNTAGSSPYTSVSTATTQPIVTTQNPPYAPYYLSATADSSSQISLKWYDNAGVETGVRVERKMGNGSWSFVTALAPHAQAYVDTGLTAGMIYTYRVASFNDGGSSPYTNESAATTAVGTTPPVVPASPSLLTTTAASSSQINLSWADNSNNETGFIVERLNGSNWSVLTTTTANATTFSDTSLTANTAYTYRVSATNAAGTSTPSNTSTATTQQGSVVVAPPFAPYYLSAIANSSSQITLNWYDNAGVETGVSVERQVGNGIFTVVATLAPHAQSYIDTGLTGSTLYTYRVASFNGLGSSPYTNISSAQTPAGTITPVSPAAPSLLTTTSDSPVQITLHWMDNSTNETGFNIEQQNGATWTVLATVPANSTSYVSTGLTPSTAYTYRVNAVNAVGASAYSNTSTATSQTVVVSPTTPLAPTSLSAAAVSSTQIAINWTDNSNNESGFNVEQLNGATWTVVATLPANSTFFTATGLTPSTAYSYRVNAFNIIGPSGYSNISGATTAASTVIGQRTDLSTFFPIGAFLQPTYTFGTWKQRGINTLVGYEAYGQNTSLEQWTQVANDNGLKYMREPLANPSLDVNDPNLLTWLYPVDEPDLVTLDQALPPAKAEFNLLRSIDPTRPIATTYAGGYMLQWLQGRDKAYYDALAQYTDWVMPCIYPVTGWNLPERINGVGNLVDLMKQWYPQKRNIAYIETSNQDLTFVGPQERGVTPDELRGEVWDAVIHGATGVVYFPQALTHFNYDATPPDVAAEMTVQNARLAKYGTALLTTENPAGTSISASGIETCWRIYNGKKYYFSLNLSPTAVNNVNLATTGLNPSQSLVVDGEGRNVTLQNGNIVENFKPFECHVYVA
jgi:hypothetical protein